MDPADYCRQVEAYLCRKNDGHLIRIVGPTFDRVSCWAEQGVPLSVVFQGVDRGFKRYYAKKQRRRPLSIAFCEVYVLYLFDEWRQAVGIRNVATNAKMNEGDSQDELTLRRCGLPSHVERVITKLTKLRSDTEAVPGLHQVISRIINELDAQRVVARVSRGDARNRLIARLNALDSDLMAGARRGTGIELLEMLRRTAEIELETFRSRMIQVVFNRALENCTDRLLRDRLGLPRVSFDS